MASQTGPEKFVPLGDYTQTLSSFRGILSTVPTEVRVSFLESMVFKNGGFVGAYIGEIQKCLSEDEFLNLFAHLGMSPEVARDHIGFKCSGPGNCIKNSNYVCNPAHCT